jgi:hypothetical protein
MPKVLCTLPNASSLINGVQFISHKDGMVSEEVSAEVAAKFFAVNGYKEFVIGEKTDPNGDNNKSDSDADDLDDADTGADAGADKGKGKKRNKGAGKNPTAGASTGDAQPNDSDDTKGAGSPL